MQGDYSLYEHVFPDGKRYIGISRNPQKRWKQDGTGYISNQPMWKAINTYGWENIEHNILASNLSREEAKKQERETIKKTDSQRKGYNQRPGGQLSSGYYSKHVRKMIRALKTYSWMNSDFIPTYKRLIDLENDECWACELNYVDSMIRNETDGFTHGLAEWMSEKMYEVLDWYFYLQQYILHPDVDFRYVKNQMREKRSDIE